MTIDNIQHTLTEDAFFAFAKQVMLTLKAVLKDKGVTLKID